jgi:tungstate transport system permease protein
VDLIWQGFVDAVGLIARGDGELARVATLSLLVSVSATLLAAVVGVPAGAMLALGRIGGLGLVQGIVNTGMGLPPVVVGLGISILLWRTGPFGFLHLLYTPGAMVLAQFIVAVPIVAGLTRVALDAVDRDVLHALRADGASEVAAGWQLVLAARPQVTVAVAVAFGRAISEVGASLMVGGNLQGQTRILTTAISLETSKGEFARAIALGMVLLALAFAVNAGLSLRGIGWSPRNRVRAQS